MQKLLLQTFPKPLSRRKQGNRRPGKEAKATMAPSTLHIEEQKNNAEQQVRSQVHNDISASSKLQKKKMLGNCLLVVEVILRNLFIVAKKGLELQSQRPNTNAKHSGFHFILCSSFLRLASLPPWHFLLESIHVFCHSALSPIIA